MDYDVIIVGAGPAGLSTALHLAQITPPLIPRTLILEKARHPRPKLCGGGILPDAEVLLQQLGLDITELPHVDVDWAHFDYEGRGFKLRPDPKRPFAFRTIRRQEFDAWLAEKTSKKGIEIRENVTVRGVKLDAEGVNVETDHGLFRTRIVVGADGSKSIIRRVVIPLEKVHAARLLEIITEPKAEGSLHIQADSYFDLMFLPQGILGYTWDFPALENGQPVRVRGIYDSNVHTVRADISLRAALTEEFQRHGYNLRDYKLEGHPLRRFEARSIFAAPRILLVGDAAGADALFGEGISIALGYGKLASFAIQDAFARDDFSFRGYKTSILRSEMGKSLRQRTWWARFFYSLRWRTFQRLAWHRLGWVIDFIMRTFLIGWARRQEKKASKF